MKNLTLNAPAKINFGLNIVSKRNDGFHNLETFFYPINDLYDTLLFERSINFRFESDSYELNKSQDNLIIKAHNLLEEYTNRELPIKITLSKRIPIGAGLGGGSSDAAAALHGLNRFLDLNIEPFDLSELAMHLGSDVPFFISSKPAIGYSRGEVLTETSILIDYPILIVNPGIHVSTKEAFCKIIPKQSEFDYNYFSDIDKIDFDLLRCNLTNDFENYIFESHLEIKNIKELMMKSGALFSLMSGTGSTVYGIFKTTAHAQYAFEQFTSNYFKFISNL